MFKNVLNFLIDLATFAVLSLLAATGLLLRFVLPPGSRGGRGLLLWGLDRHEWGDIHFWLAVALGILILVHVALHWSWVCVTAARMFRPSVAPFTAPSSRARGLWACVTAALLAFALFGFLWTSRSAVIRLDEGGGYRYERKGSGAPGHRLENGTGGHQDGGGRRRLHNSMPDSP